MKLLTAAAKHTINDEEFDVGSELSKKCLEMCSRMIQALSKPNETQQEFASWHMSVLKRVINKATRATGTINRETLWSEYHQVRLNTSFRLQWSSFLSTCSISPEPTFYQHISLECLHTLLKGIQTAANVQETVEIPALTYEEENAVRYMGGYVVKCLQQASKDKEVTLVLHDLVNKDDCEPSETEEWLAAIDRGGLTWITDGAFQLFSAIEYSIRRHLRASAIREMNDSFKATITHKIISDSDVKFHWCMVSSFSTATCSIKELVLSKLVDKWITIRGFSFANSMVELYKRTSKKGTQKSKPLRRNLATGSTT